jgi:hypothetical protein
MKRSLYLLAALLMAVLVGAGISTSAATAATSSKTSQSVEIARTGPQVVVSFQHTIQNMQTGLCLDSNYQGQVYTGPCNGGNYQVWLRVRYTLEDSQTGLCLTGDSNGNVFTSPCDPNAQTGNGDVNYHQIWYPYQNYAFENAGVTSQDHGGVAWMLDSNGNNVFTSPYNGQNDQSWYWPFDQDV